MEQRKFLDQKGVEYLWSQLSLEDYPNNALLTTVINAIDETKADRNEIPTTPEAVGADAAGTAASIVSEHDTSENAHSDIREKLLPTTAEAHQQLVTDGDGNVGWADRLAYEGISTEELLSVDNFWDDMRENTTPEGEDPNDAMPIPADTYVHFPEMPVIENFNDGAEYYVYINDTKLETTIKENKYLGIDFSEIYDGLSYSSIYYNSYYGEMVLSVIWYNGDPGFPEENVTFKIVRVGKTVVPIDSKFLPAGTVIEGQNVGSAHKQLVTDGDGNTRWDDRLAYSIPAFSFECPASSVGLESFVVANEEGDTTHYLISAGSYSLEGFKNMSITDPENQNVTTTYYQQFGNIHTVRFDLEKGYGNFTWLYWFDGQTTISDGLGGTITPQAGIWQGTGGDAARITAFTANYAGKVQTIDPKYLSVESVPKCDEAHQQLVTDASGNVMWDDRTHYHAQELATITLDTSTFTKGSNGTKLATITEATAGLLERSLRYMQCWYGEMYSTEYQFDWKSGSLWSNYLGSYTGNGNFIDSRYESTSDDYCLFIGYSSIDYTENIVVLYVAESVDSVKIEWATVDELKQLDEKYIPDTIARTADLVAITTAISGKVDAEVGMGLSANSYTDEEKTKVASIDSLIQTASEAMKAYTDTEVAALVNSAPETLDTLGELAAAFEENQEVVEALDASITNKQDKVSDTLILVDAITGSQYKIQIQNGQLVSFPVE